MGSAKAVTPDRNIDKKTRQNVGLLMSLPFHQIKVCNYRKKGRSPLETGLKKLGLY
jgi:hypothetical protein